MKRIGRDEKIDVRLSSMERDLILDHTFIDQDHVDILKSADSQAGHITVGLTLEDLDLILGHIAASTNHAEDMKLRYSLEELYDHLEDIESRYALLED